MNQVISIFKRSVLIFFALFIFFCGQVKSQNFYGLSLGESYTLEEIETEITKRFNQESFEILQKSEREIAVNINLDEQEERQLKLEFNPLTFRDSKLFFTRIYGTLIDKNTATNLYENALNYLGKPSEGFEEEAASRNYNGYVKKVNYFKIYYNRKFEGDAIKLKFDNTMYSNSVSYSFSISYIYNSKWMDKSTPHSESAFSNSYEWKITKRY
ncbi:MAG: hypothetical protein JXR36_02585 [Bacteroidales bacterium]|nr:hypothetical protein [Bacteroidales bacterium]